ncbi:hypothetical protein [Limnohabitans sp. DM1]|uniref:hypothetical protein n=1 Tax=Limnohabitans sp. DM1 TaxID=1597955 RepID=UPI000AD028EA|nr:hypothetical protein [Limnohabitans sp. DM1]
MPLFITQETAVFGTSIPLSDFAPLLAAHRARYQSTLDIEKKGVELQQANFPTQAVQDFVTAVCTWGGYAGISGRILKRNSLEAIANALRSAVNQLNAEKPNVAGALACINALDSLGTPSFASKHLRFLRPDICPVFDSLLQEALPYSFDATGYAQFSKDCCSLAKTLTQQKNSAAPDREMGEWCAADVEGAIFAYVTELKN